MTTPNIRINSSDFSDRLELLEEGHEPCCIVDFREGDVRIYRRAESETGTPMWVHHGHGMLVRLVAVQAIDATRLDDVLEFIRPELAAVLDSYASEWDGSNSIGRVDDDAYRLLEDAILGAVGTIDLGRDFENAGLWDAVDWLAGIGSAQTCIEYGITARSSNEELVGIASRIREEAKSEAVALYGLDEHLMDLREELRREALYAEPMLTAATIADLLEITPRRAQQLLKEHEASIYDGARWLFPEALLEDLRNRKTQPGPERRST